MKMPKFTEKELNHLEAGHQVKKGKYTYRIYGKYSGELRHWILVLQRIKEYDEDWEDYKTI